MLLFPHDRVGADAQQSLYLLAGTVSAGAYVLKTNPVNLYTVGSHEKLALVRKIYSSNQNLLDFADDLHGQIYLASSPGNQGTSNLSGIISVVHEDDPYRADSVPLGHFDDFPCWGAVHNQLLSAVQYCYLNQTIEVSGNPESDETRVVAGNWALFNHFQYSGMNGGPFQMNIPVGQAASGEVMLPSSNPKVTLAKLSPSDAGMLDGRLAWVIASTDRFFVFMVEPTDFLRLKGGLTHEHPGHAGPLGIYILDKETKKWRTLDLPTAITGYIHPMVRMFEPWLVTTVAEWRPGPDQSPGHDDHERKWSNAQFPDVNGGYGTLFFDLYLPGKIVLDNLLDGGRITLDTGQEDSEVLLIQNGAILYRVNESIYSAKIVDDQVIEPKLVVTDTDVPEIHWAFWGPGTKSANSK